MNTFGAQDSINNYRRDVFLGQGGFGVCYAFINERTKQKFAGKILHKSHNESIEGLLSEVAIHKALNHRNVVQFYNYFIRDYQIYIIMEYCEGGSLLKLKSRRNTITEWEGRYFFKQILEGVQYLHSNQILHRDIKLANLLLTNKLQVKICDFGLSVQLKADDERLIDGCGTFLAPEMIKKTGYSFEVDVWSIGCTIFALLAGYYPFETNGRPDTIRRILNAEYKMSGEFSEYGKLMINRIFQVEPSHRPSIEQLLECDWLNKEYTPNCLPMMCFNYAPNLNMLKQYEVGNDILSYCDEHYECRNINDSIIW